LLMKEARRKGGVEQDQKVVRKKGRHSGFENNEKHEKKVVRFHEELSRQKASPVRRMTVYWITGGDPAT